MQSLKSKLMNLLRKGREYLSNSTQKLRAPAMTEDGIYMTIPEPKADFEVNIGLSETPNEADEEMVKRYIPSVNQEAEK